MDDDVSRSKVEIEGRSSYEHRCPRCASPLHYVIVIVAYTRSGQSETKGVADARAERQMKMMKRDQSRGGITAGRVVSDREPSATD